MEYIEIIGFIAGSIAVAAFLPQAVKTFKTKEAQDLSFVMLLLQTTCVFLWMVYGILKNSPSLMICNFATLLIVGSVFLMKIRYGKRESLKTGAIKNS
ncbi:hypothetical protein KJ966_20315 [bacterium]|nr:hypothetical protein [bacterium]